MKRTQYSLIFILLAAAIVAYLSLICPWLGDDMNYGLSRKTLLPLASLSDVFISMKQMYLGTNGRYVSHFLVQVILGLTNHIVFALCNFVAFVFLVLMILRSAHVRLNNPTFVAIAACATIVGLQTKFVPSCQIVYAWMFLLILVFLEVFIHHHRVGHWRALVWVLLALLAGNASDALGIGVAGALFLYVLTHRRQVTPVQWCMLAAFIIGLVILVASPGTRSRISDSQGVSFLGSLPLSAYTLITSLRVTWVMLLVLGIALHQKTTTWRHFYSENTFWVNVLLLCFAINVYIHINNNRQLFGMELASLILLLKLLWGLHLRGLHHIVKVILVVAIVMVIAIVASDVRVANRRAHDYEAVCALYKQSLEGVVFYDVVPEDMFADGTDPCDPIRQNNALAWVSHVLQLQADNSGKPLRLLPKALYPLPANNATYSDAGGNIYAVCHKNTECQVVLKRSIVLLGIKRPHSDLVLKDESSAIYSDSLVMVFLLEKNPLISNDSVVFQRCKTSTKE